MAQDVLESRGICNRCKRYMTNQQELTTIEGETIHRACLPALAKMEKKPNSYT
jgi:hypothetical protein